MKKKKEALCDFGARLFFILHPFPLSPQPRARAVHLKRVRFLPFLLFPLFAVPALAQQRWEGTLTQTQDGLSAKAQIYAQAPDRLRVEIARDDAAGVPAQIVVASGDQTLRYEPATKRLFRARFNILKKWDRDWRLAAGGPANFVFAGASAGIVNETEGRFLRRDNVLFGGGGENAFYAAAKTLDSLYPAKVELSGTPPTQRVETAVGGTQSLSATITYAGALPTKVAVVAAGENSTFTYDLSARAEPFADATWTIEGADKALAEETDLRAPSAYANAKDADDLLNGGIALWRGAGDFRAAQQRFVAASNLSPTASAPLLASFEMALDARDLTAAGRALEALAPLGLDSAEIEARRARLAIANRDWDGALAALDKALGSAPQSPDLQLARAQALLGKADVEGRARRLENSSHGAGLARRARAGGGSAGTNFERRRRRFGGRQKRSGAGDAGQTRPWRRANRRESAFRARAGTRRRRCQRAGFVDGTGKSGARRSQESGARASDVAGGARGRRGCIAGGLRTAARRSGFAVAAR